MVIVSDGRGILVEALTYNKIVFKIRKRTPDTLFYYKGNNNLKNIKKPEITLPEVYTLEFSSDLQMYWLNYKLNKSPSDFKIPPLPFMPIKQIRINVSNDGTINTLKFKIFQVENWTKVKWHGIHVWVPYGLPDPTIDIVPYILSNNKYYNMRFIFQVQFPRKNISEQWVAIWWVDDLDSGLSFLKSNSSSSFSYNPSIKEVIHRQYKIEFLDEEHKIASGYETFIPSTSCHNAANFDPDKHLHYWGIAAFLIRDPKTDEPQNVFNIQGFDVLSCYPYTYMARYRPYGIWKVYHNYSNYGISAPLRIYAVLNTTLVGDIYRLTESRGIPNWFNVRNDYYDTLSIVEIINGTRYIPVIIYIYWKNSFYGYGYWTAMSSGVVRSSSSWHDSYGWFMYLRYPAKRSIKENSTDRTPVNYIDYDWIEKLYPGIMISQWGTKHGKSLIFGKKTLNSWYTINNQNNPMTSSYMCGNVGLCSADFQLFRRDKRSFIQRGLLLSYTVVYFVYDLEGEGWLGKKGKNGWLNSYIYTPMFFEKYSPVIVKP